MQTLSRSLQDHDLGHLRIVAEMWGLGLPAGPAPRTARALAELMLDPSALQETLGGLDPTAHEAFEFLLTLGGRSPAADYDRRFGPLREMGPGRRDREKPWRSPSPAESLWYRGLIARAFADTPTGPEEFVFIPADMLELIQPPSSADSAPMGKPATIPIATRLTDWGAADDATTLLAALRRRTTRSAPSPEWHETFAAFLRRPAAAPLILAVLRAEGVLDPASLRPVSQAVRTFLDQPRPSACRQLLKGWQTSTLWNDLAHTPGLSSGTRDWPNDPVASRQAALSHLHGIPADSWWDLAAWLEAVRSRDPGFQRPGGDFLAWYLQDVGTGDFLRGFERWEQVDGAYLRFLITGPLHWLGAVDLGLGEDGTTIDRFRKTSLASALSDASSTSMDSAEDEPAPLAVYPDGRVEVPASASRSLRYQIARVCDWEPAAPPMYAYRVTPSSLRSAGAQGLGASQVLALLESAGRRPIPQGLREAIEGAFAHPSIARIEHRTILRVGSASTMQRLRRERSTSRYLGEELGATAALVRPRDWPALCAAAARIGILIDPPRDLAP